MRQCSVSKRIPAVVLAAAVLLAAPGALVAHHGAATFDTSQEITLTGTVTEWSWFNPHVFLKFDVTGEDGTVTSWAAEGGNPTDWSRRGWGRRAFKPGEEVTVTVQPASEASSSPTAGH